MAPRPVSVKAVGYGLSLSYGLILAVSLCAFIISFFNQDAILNSSLFVGKFHSIAEFQRHTITLWLLFFPQLVGLIGVLMLKEWGRKLVILMNATLCIYFSYRMAFELKELDVPSVIAVVINIFVILFFSWPKVREQFKEGTKPKKRILIIDDDKGLLKMMKVNLTSHGFVVLTADTGEKGLEAAKKEKPHLIILDVILPGIKGREVCSRLKKDPQTQDIPVIFLTAKNSQDDIKAELEAGAISHLTKPLDFHDVLSEINKIFGG